MSENQFLGLRDLFTRWVYTRQGIYLVMRWPDFPPPAFTINNGKTQVWKRTDIEALECNHSELVDDGAKYRKVIGYMRASAKKVARRRLECGFDDDP